MDGNPQLPQKSRVTDPSLCEMRLWWKHLKHNVTLYLQMAIRKWNTTVWTVYYPPLTCDSHMFIQILPHHGLYSSHLYKKQQARDNDTSVSVKNEQQCLMSDCKLHAHVIRNTYKRKWLWQACTQGGGGGGYSWEFLVGLCHPVVQILTLFSKIVIFHTCFQTSPLKSIPIFRPGL